MISSSPRWWANVSCTANFSLGDSNIGNRSGDSNLVDLSLKPTVFGLASSSSPLFLCEDKDACS